MRYTSLAAVILLSAAFVFAADDAAKEDLAKLQGEWSMVWGEQGGVRLPEGMVKTSKRTFEGDQLTVIVGGVLFMKAKVTLDVTTSPKQLDYHLTAGPNAGKTQLGIYELADDGTIKFCFAATGNDRPTDFTTTAGDGRTASVWKRQAK